MSREVSGGLLINWTVLSIECRFPRSKMSSANQSAIKQAKVKKNVLQKFKPPLKYLELSGTVSETSEFD
uniref:Uncharacterized protein n=1 Tax=Magallana gigas TaxID=29159 RepID=A0A8W8N7I0_MAGGI